VKKKFQEKEFFTLTLSPCMHLPFNTPTYSEGISNILQEKAMSGETSLAVFMSL
jgi:hypothetical protein